MTLIHFFVSLRRSGKSETYLSDVFCGDGGVGVDVVINVKFDIMLVLWGSTYSSSVLFGKQMYWRISTFNFLEKYLTPPPGVLTISFALFSCNCL